MSKRQEHLKAIGAVEMEYVAAVSASALLQEQLRIDPRWGQRVPKKSVGYRKWRNRDAERMIKKLIATYVIRMFAEFEAALRALWVDNFDRHTVPRLLDLVDAIASRLDASRP